MKLFNYLIIISILTSTYSCKKERFEEAQNKERQQVIDDWYNIKRTNELYFYDADVPSGACQKGYLKPDIYTKLITQFNYYRKLAGCEPVVLDSLFNEQTQAYLLTAILNKDSVRIHPGLKCYSQEAANAWGKVISSSSFHTNQSSPIPHFISHSGDNRKDLINRIWVLYPQLNKIGYGQLNSYFGIKVTGEGTENTAISTPEYVAWPPKGFILNEIINSAGVWSFTILNADLKDAVVNVKTRDFTKAKLKSINKLPMKELEVKIIEKQMNTHLEDRTVFWTIKDIVVDDAYEDEDREYEVSISNVKVGNAYKSYKYTTYIMNKYSYNK
jgi:hypothetical protein